MKLAALLFTFSSACCFAKGATLLRSNDALMAVETGDSDRHHRILLEDLVGTYLKGVFEHTNKTTSESDNIEVKDGAGAIYEITNPGNSGWARGLKSGLSVIAIAKGATIKGSKLDVHGRPPRGVSDSLPNEGGLPGSRGKNPFARHLRQDMPATTEQEVNWRKLEHQHRQLAAATGTLKVLAVRVIHTGAGSLPPVTHSKEVIAENIFGAAIGGTDPVNLHSQYLACSHGKLNIQPASNATSSNGIVTNIENGIVEVTVNTNCTNLPCDFEMRNDINDALNATFGPGILGGALAHIVMHCLPPYAMGYISYTFMNYWYSVFSDTWCEYPSTQLHEIGHMLGLAHSGEMGDDYDDRTCLMGYSYSIDDQAMCFNNAKNWQLNWFTGAYKELVLNQAYNGPIKGHVNYDVSGLTQAPIVVKVGKYYIGFNHAVKHNVDTMEAPNQVTIQEADGLNLNNVKSWLVAKLGHGDTWTVEIGGKTLKVVVNSIDADREIGAAHVNIMYGACLSNSDCDVLCGLQICGLSGVCEVNPTPQTNCCGNSICEAGEDSTCTDCPKTLKTTWAQGNGGQGNTFSVTAQNAVNINAFTVHLKDISTGQVIVWAREGTYAGFENNSTGWTKIQDVIVSSGGSGTETVLPRLPSFYFMASGSTHSFHVWSALNLRYTNGLSGEGQPWTCAENPGDLIFYEGKGCHNQFACINAPRVWNGKITYTLATSTAPTLRPTSIPTSNPTINPSSNPTGNPTSNPTNSPTPSPSNNPTSNPTTSPTPSPSNNPTSFPTLVPTSPPTNNPTPFPTLVPTSPPTLVPGFCTDGSGRCTDTALGHFITNLSGCACSSTRRLPKANPPPTTPLPTTPPTNNPTSQPTNKPTSPPTSQPTNKPTNNPTSPPTNQPTNNPTSPPTSQPTNQPTNNPTSPPSSKPTSNPTFSPTTKPTFSPTTKPTSSPTAKPTSSPSVKPSPAPTAQPTSSPTLKPTSGPTYQPSVCGCSLIAPANPTSPPSIKFTISPTKKPVTAEPSIQPTQPPTNNPTGQPTQYPTHIPTDKPTSLPSLEPTASPTKKPVTDAPTTQSPTLHPVTPDPTKQPTQPPTNNPTNPPTNIPTPAPTTLAPTLKPTVCTLTAPNGSCSDGTTCCSGVCSVGKPGTRKCV